MALAVQKTETTFKKDFLLKNIKKDVDKCASCYDCGTVSPGSFTQLR